MNKILFLFFLYIFNTLSFYTYDRFNNRAIPVNNEGTLIYYTSDVFHSIEYADKNKSYNTSNTSILNKNITLRKKNSKSLPNLYYA